MKEIKSLIKIFMADFVGLFIIILFTAGCLKGPGKAGMDQGETQRVFSFSGIITKDAVWSGVVQIEDDLLIPKGINLTIQPGTKIIIREKDTSKNEPLFLSPYNEILVRGKIIAKGKEDRPIIFSGEGKARDGIYWAGIILDRSEECTLKFCEIKNAYAGIDCLESAFIVENSLFEKNKYAIISSGGNSGLKIRGNTISKNYAGIYCIFYSTGEITGNKIENNEEEGIFIGARSNLILKDNNINYNKYDIRQE
ncbi:MAG: right-handed parallel beta-helix repeat-containing protein [bacterium]|nr:right-handed parallel beta-helix repeat-containing protein [bacterium]